MSRMIMDNNLGNLGGSCHLFKVLSVLVIQFLGSSLQALSYSVTLNFIVKSLKQRGLSINVKHTEIQIILEVTAKSNKEIKLICIT